MPPQKIPLPRLLPLIGISAAILFGGLFLWGLYGSKSERVPGEEVSLLTQEAKNSSLVSENFSFIPPAGWTRADETEVKLPWNITGASFAYRKDGTSCVFARVRSATSTLQRPAVIQSSFASREFTSDGEQLDSSWHILESETPPGFEFKWDGRQPLQREVRINTYPTFWNDYDKSFENAFILFSEDGSIVPDDCDADFRAMLRSLKRHYEPTTLDTHSRGALYLGFSGGNNQTIRLLYTPDASTIAREVYRPGEIRSARIAAYRDYLYFVSETKTGAALYQFNPFTKQANALASTADSESILDYAFVGDKIFYLTGSADCYRECDSSLFEYTPDTSPPTLLTTGLKSTNIVGYVPEEKMLYFRHGYGDAGCYWFNVDTYSFLTGTATNDLVRFGSCVDEEPGYTENKNRETAFYSRIPKGPTRVPYLRIQDGHLLPPGEEKFMGVGAHDIDFVPNPASN